MQFIVSLIGIGIDGKWDRAWAQRKKLLNLRVLIIDEVSMVSAEFFDQIDFILTYIRKYVFSVQLTQ
jgi:ATP-dependent exoDNAse (exonuclease V) alpha subunit